MSSSPSSGRGTLYVLQALSGGPYKIGWTSKPSAKARRADAQTYHPETLCLLRETPAYAAQEKAVHKLLEAFRLSGEWFRDDPPVREFVDFLSAGSLDSYLTTPNDPA